LLWYTYTRREGLLDPQEVTLMYRLIVKGARRTTLAVHTCDSPAELQELLAVYHAYGYAPEALIVEEISQEQAA
jgi:hypothetical protein